MDKFILIIPSFDGKIYSLNKNYIEIFKKNNIPYYICDYNFKNLNYEKIGGILLTGGGDISQRFLHEPINENANDICEIRDIFEIQLLKDAYSKKIPTLGICRGAQIMNIAFGGTINQHIEGHIQKEDRNIKSHDILVNKNSEFYKAIGENIISVNSFHHQVIDNIADKFSNIGISYDGYIEGIELINKDYYFLGVQWHPEALDDEISQKIFESFVKRVYNVI